MNAMMSVLNNNLLRVLFITIAVIIIFLYNIVDGAKDCERLYCYYKELSGNFRIDTLYMDIRIHGDIMQSKNNLRLEYLSEDLVIQPCIGDSIYKEKGKLEYVLIKADSTYVQSWNCETKGAFIIDKWKNGEKKYVPSNKAIPQPDDTSNSINISTK